jgi:HEAT repeats
VAVNNPIHKRRAPAQSFAVQRQGNGVGSRGVGLGDGGNDASFSTILAEIKRDCGLEEIPYDKISALARVCGPGDVDLLIRELDALDDADLEDDAGDMRDEYCPLRTAYSQALAEVGEPAIEPLLRGLDSGNPETRAAVARSLGVIGTQRAYGPIVAALAEARDDMLRMKLIEALKRIDT